MINQFRPYKPLTSQNAVLPWNTLGIALVSATILPIRAEQARSKQGQSNTSTSKARRTTQKTSLRWDVFLAQHTCHRERFASRRKTAAVAADFVNPYFWEAGRRSGRRAYCRRAGASTGELGCGERQESDDDLRQPWPRRSFLWHQYSSGAISKCPFRRATGGD
jgi:hypothetical protein